jgi:hypothetical protein
MGCGCPDGDGCASSYRGFNRQVDCMAQLLREFVTQLEGDGTTISGWAVGRSKSTLDGYSVRPANTATAALYTYTPWVVSNRDHYSIWRDLADAVGYQAPGPGGCGVAAFPSGARLQLVPDADLTAQYTEGETPSCFLAADSLLDPATLVTYNESLQLSPNFRLNEFVAAASSRTMLLAPELVDALQRIRSHLGRPITVDVAYQSPAAFEAACGGVCEGDSCPSAPSCEDPRELTRGTAALLDGGADLLASAAAVGVGSCWQEGERVFVGVGTALGCPR